MSRKLKTFAVPTKIARRPTPNFVDSLIGSIGALYLTIISFVLIYSYVGINLYQHNQTLPALIALDKLLVLRDLSSGTHSYVREAKIKDLPNFLIDAMWDKFNEPIKEADEVDKEDELEDAPERKKSELEPKKSEKTPSKFTEELLQNSQILREISMRMAIGGTCNVLVTRLFPGHNFNIATVVVVTDTYTVKSEDVQFAIFRGCEPGPSGEFKILIFKLDDGQFAFAVPSSLGDQFRRPPSLFGFSNFKFRELNQIKKLLPQPMAEYVHFMEEYVILHGKAVDYFVLNYAETQLRKYFPASRLDEAVQQVYEQKENDASYFGITAPNTLLVRIGPLIYFILSFELWRRVRRLPTGRLLSEKYWFAFETRDIVGRTYSFLYAFAPIAFGVLIYALFAISQELGLVVFGRAVTIPGLLTLSFPMILGPAWATPDYFALAIALALVPAHFLILLLTVRKLFAVVAANMRQT
jgi:hypothetical protein